MKSKIIPVSVAAMMFIGGCTTIQKSRSSKTMDIYGSGVIHVPVVADLKVSETKVVGVAVGRSGELPDAVKQRALAEAMESSNADILIEPSYKSTVNGTTVTYTVTGFPAHYKNFRNAVAADTAIMKIGYRQQATKNENPVAPKKNKAAGAVLGTLTAIALVVLLIALI